MRKNKTYQSLKILICLLLYCEEVPELSYNIMTVVAFPLYKKARRSDFSRPAVPLPRNRSDGIRTHDLCVPNAALYQTEPRFVIAKNIIVRLRFFVNKISCDSEKGMQENDDLLS